MVFNRTVPQLWRFVLLTTCLTASICQLQAQKHIFLFEGKKRSYIVHLPASYKKEIAYPLVLNFHGLGSNAEDQQAYTQMDKVADKEHFIVVYPQAQKRGWNSGIGFKPYKEGKNDIGFVNNILDTLVHRYNIDTQRIYSVGVSIGGSFNYRLACELSHRIAAIASVSGLMSDSTFYYCQPARDIPIIHFHGTSDFIMKQKGIKQSLGVEETIKFWTLYHHCMVPGDTIRIPNRCKDDKTFDDLIQYKSCLNGSEVWFYKIYNGGHTWPGGGKQHYMMGKKNRDIDASEAIWEFFKRFTLQTGTIKVPAQ